MSSPAATWTLAIDFGTSNSAAAHSAATTGTVETLSLSHTSHLMPSSVYVASPDQIYVGDAALNQAQRDPAGFVPAPKRLITGQPSIIVNEIALPSYALVAAVLATVLNRGKAAHAGQPPAQVVLTHPEAWADQQIKILIDAAIQVGIDPTRIVTISEPRAAAAHYSRSHRLPPGAKIGVFDFGGGTLDVAVLTVGDNSSFSVVAARGNNGLGGKNFDAIVQRWVEERLSERDPQLADWLRRYAPVDVIQGLQQSIRTAKELLSEAPSATITVNGPTGRQTLQITRDEFDELIGPAVEQAMSLTKATLLDAGITHPEQLLSLYLTGGSSRIPLIQQRLGELGPVATLDDPKTVVAQGALVSARQAAAAATRQHPTAAPTAGDLMPSWQGRGARNGAPPANPVAGQTTPSMTPQLTDPPPARRRRWGLIAGGGIAVVAVIGIAVGVISLSHGGGDSKTASSSSTTTSAAATTGTDGGRIITDQAQAFAVLPAQLQQQIDRCNKSGFDPNNAVIFVCEFKDDSTLAALGPKYSLSMSFYVDDNQAAGRIVNIRNGVYSSGKGTLVEDSGRVSAADIYNGTGQNQFDFASTADGLNVSVSGLNSLADGKTFLSESGLIS